MKTGAARLLVCYRTPAGLASTRRLHAIGEAVLHRKCSRASVPPVRNRSETERWHHSKRCGRVTLYKSRALSKTDVAPFAVSPMRPPRPRLGLARVRYDIVRDARGHPVALAKHLLLFLSTRWSVKIRCWVAFRTCDDKEATHALALSSTAALCELKEEAPRGRFFSFQRRIYVQDV